MGGWRLSRYTVYGIICKRHHGPDHVAIPHNQVEVDLLKGELGAAVSRSGKLSEYTERLSIALDLSKVWTTNTFLNLVLATGHCPIGLWPQGSVCSIPPAWGLRNRNMSSTPHPVHSFQICVKERRRTLGLIHRAFRGWCHHTFIAVRGPTASEGGATRLASRWGARE